MPHPAERQARHPPPTALVAIACVTAAAIGVTLSDRRGSVIASPPPG